MQCVYKESDTTCNQLCPLQAPTFSPNYHSFSSCLGGTLGTKPQRSLLKQRPSHIARGSTLATYISFTQCQLSELRHFYPWPATSDHFLYLPTMLDFDSSIGALLVCLLASLTLYGITIVQTYLYYTNYSEDTSYMKCLVFSLFILDSLDSLFISHSMYSLLVTRFGQPQALMATFENMWSISGGTVVTAMAAFLTQLFFGSRVWRLSHRNWLLTSLIVVFSLIQFAFTIWFSTLCLTESAIYVKSAGIKWMLLVPFSCATACDTIITASICWFLHQMPTDFARTRLLINKLIFFTVNNSLWTTVIVLIDLVAFLLWPDNLVYVGLFFLLNKLYTNSLLATLNTRKTLRIAFIPSFDFSGAVAIKGTLEHSPQHHTNAV